MNGKDDRTSCSIKETIRIICPKCDMIIVVPMHKAVNGEKIICTACNFEFEFRLP